MSKRKHPPRLDPDHAQTLRDKLEWEGDLLYVVENWEFKEFRDKKFNSLRKALIEAARKFCDYTGCNEEPNDEEEIDDTSASPDEVCTVCGDTMIDGYCTTCQE